MNREDRRLGMDRSITRRDFLNGVGVTVVGSMLAPELTRAAEQERHASAQTPSAGDPAFAPERAADYYPPTRTGMRGSHPGSFEVAHQLRDAGRWDLSGATATGQTYDLVIVGGGLSGLSAAWYFARDAGRNARMLILDNHDDFGGHAKRNEFQYNGRLLALNGGTLNIESWNRYNEHARSLITEIGLDISRFLASNQKNRTLYTSLGLTGQAVFFDKETWGADTLVVRRRGGGGGHAYTYNPLYDPLEWVYTSSSDRPCVKARQPFGLIAIANSDAAASPHTDAAMLEAHRAVQEVLQRRAMPLLSAP